MTTNTTEPGSHHFEAEGHPESSSHHAGRFGKVFVGIIVAVVVLIAGGVILTENDHSTTSDVAGMAAAPPPTPMAKWATSNGDAFGELVVEFRAAGDASASNDYAGIRSACRDVADTPRTEVLAGPLQTHI